MNREALTTEEHMAIVRVASRFTTLAALQGAEDVPAAFDVAIAVTTAHRHGCRLRLAELAAAGADDLLHDVGGILEHLDRRTGQVGGLFFPRYAVVEASA